MSPDLDNPRTWLSAALAGVAGLFAWSAKRHVAQYDAEREALQKQVGDHSTRIRALESAVATREDIDGVHTRINSLGDTMNEQHARLLEALLKRGS